MRTLSTLPLDPRPVAARPHPVLAGNPAQQELLDAGLLSTGFRANLASQLPETRLAPELPDVNGIMQSVTAMKGKYVLVSFWSTTEQECMNELAQLKTIYEAYHRKGLEIFQVSLDPDEERWKNIVRFEEIPWISVREQDPENPVYSRLMNITRLPSSLLYDPEGNIINTNLTGRNLSIRMDQLFNK